MEQKIDATNQILGRLAVRVALILRGKNRPDFDPARPHMQKLTVFNTDKIKVTGKKFSKKLYRHHSGYPGGLKEEKMADVHARDSRLILRRAVLGMLPKNRLRSRFIKNLILVKGGK